MPTTKWQPSQGVLSTIVILVPLGLRIPGPGLLTPSVRLPNPSYSAFVLTNLKLTARVSESMTRKVHTPFIHSANITRGVTNVVPPRALLLRLRRSIG